MIDSSGPAATSLRAPAETQAAAIAADFFAIGGWELAACEVERKRKRREQRAERRARRSIKRRRGW